MRHNCLAVLLVHLLSRLLSYVEDGLHEGTSLRPRIQILRKVFRSVQQIHQGGQTQGSIFHCVKSECKTVSHGAQAGIGDVEFVLDPVKKNADPMTKGLPKSVVIEEVPDYQTNFAKIDQIVKKGLNHEHGFPTFAAHKLFRCKGVAKLSDAPLCHQLLITVLELRQIL